MEAGLRTYDIKSPYPEEFNRQAVSIISKYDFAPTKQAQENLLKQGKDKKRIWVTGNTVIDALKTTKTIPLIKNVLEFYYIENTGTAWGMFGGGRIFFLVLTVIIMAVLVYITYKLPTTKKYMLMRITIILLGSGAVGNFIDRLFLGYVRDFIYFRLINFPVFNVADCYVTIGLALFIIMILFIYKDEDFNFLKPDRKGSNE